METSAGRDKLDSLRDICIIAVSRFSDCSEESSDETVVDCTDTKDRSELSEASELGLVTSIIEEVLAVLTDAGGNTEVLSSLMVMGAGGNGKAVVGLQDFDFDEILTDDMVVASAETTEHGREYFKSADSVLVLFVDARVCDLKHGIF